MERDPGLRKEDQIGEGKEREMDLLAERIRHNRKCKAKPPAGKARRREERKTVLRGCVRLVDHLEDLLVHLLVCNPDLDSVVAFSPLGGVLR